LDKDIFWIADMPGLLSPLSVHLTIEVVPSLYSIAYLFCYVLGGYTYSFGPAYVNAWLIKTDSDGNEEWNRTYGISGINEAHSLLVTDDGGYILAGETPVEDHLNAWIIKTDSRGIETWNKTFKDRVEYSYSTANAVQRTDDGGYILAGYQVNSDDDFLLIKIDSDGGEEWTKAYGDPKQDEEAFAVLQSSDGGYLIAGNKGISPDSDGWVVKVDSNGREEWNKTFGDQEDAGIGSIQETSDGGFILAGKKEHGAWLLKLKG
jgi:hypothetical protein